MYEGKVPSCRSDNDCQLDHYCLDNKWEYNDQVDTMRGCWKRSVCMGTGAYSMFEERIIQWWCTDEQLEANKDMPVPFSGLVPLEEKAYTGEWERACE